MANRHTIGAPRKAGQEKRGKKKKKKLRLLLSERLRDQSSPQSESSFEPLSDAEGEAAGKIFN